MSDAADQPEGLILITCTACGQEFHWIRLHTPEWMKGEGFKESSGPETCFTCLNRMRAYLGLPPDTDSPKRLLEIAVRRGFLTD